MSRPIVEALLAFAFVAAPAWAQGEDRPAVASPASVRPDEPSLYVFLATPADLNGLIARFANPDFVLLEGARYQALIERAAATPSTPAPAAAIRSIVVGGRLEDDRADLDLRFEFLVETEEPVRASLRLDGLVLSEVTSEGVVIPVSVAPGAGWVAELRGAGRREVRVRLTAPIRASGEQRRLDLPLVEAPMTRVDLAAPASLTRASLRSGEGLTVRKAADGVATVAGLLPPRPRLELEWTSSSPEAEPARPVLTAQFEHAIALEPGLARISSTATIRAERGSASEVGIDLDATFEEPEILADGQPVDPEVIRRDPDVAGRLWIPRSLSTQRPLELTVRARRPLPSDDSATWIFRGIPIVDTSTQTGLLAVSASDELVASGRPLAGLRAIDPRTELSPALRTRPSVVLGYRLLQQPCRLELRIDRARAWLAARSRSTVWSDDRTLRVETWLDYRVPRGRLTRLDIDLPDSLRLADVGPVEVVASSEVTRPQDAPAGTRRLILRLAEAATATGQFAIRLSGVQDLVDSGELRVALPRPRDVDDLSALVAVVDSRDIAFQPVGGDGAASGLGPPPASWPWPSERPDLRAPRIAWIPQTEHETGPLLHVERLRRELVSRAVLQLRLDRRGVEIREEFDLLLEHGQIDSLELGLPRGLASDWQLLGVDVRRRRPLPPGEDGRPRLLVELARPIDVRSSVRFRGRVDFDTPLEPGESRSCVLPEFTLEGIPIAAREVMISAEPGLELHPETSDWQADERASAVATWTREDQDDAPVLSVEIRRPRGVELPPVYVSRLSVVSTWTPEASISVECRLNVARHDGSVEIELPRGAEWVGARVGNASLDEIEVVEPPSRYRLRLPSGESESILEFSYVVPRASESGGWWGPTLPSRAAVDSSVWEVRLPPTYTLLGTPAGWEDLNTWRWEGYGWRRQPPADSRRTEPTAGSLARVGRSYLFGRVGAARSGSPWIVPLPALIALSSTVAFTASLLAFAGWKRQPGLVAAVGFLIAALIGASENVLILQLLQSGIAGIGLGLLTGVLRSRRLRPGPLEPPTGVPGIEAVPSDSGRPVAMTGPEDSTILRRRAPSTASRGSAIPSEVSGEPRP